jgi:serine/threonine protein kinase
MGSDHSSYRDDVWGFEPGDAMTERLTAMKLLGGGIVYQAYVAFDSLLYAPVVVKMVRPGQVHDDGALRGLRREVECLTRVQHPSVVRHFRAELTGERPHLVLEHLDGPRLSSLIRRHGPLPEQQYLPLGVELAAAVHYFGHLALVHLDIKPGNIIMGAPAKLIDLSIARSLEACQSLTHHVGTDSYMAPEQCSPPDWGVPSHASDIYGIGATLYHAIEGTRAFKGDRRTGDLHDRFPQLRTDPPPLTRRVWPDLAALVMSCLDRDPRNRPTPQQLVDALEPAMERAPKGKLVYKVR